MKVDHKANFFFAYAYIKSEGDSDMRLLNIIKGLAYLPLVGVVAQAIFMIYLGKPHNNELAGYAALTSRLFVSLLCPFFLPIIDAVATVWFNVRESKK